MTSLKGANAIRALRALGMLDHVLTKVDPSDLQPRPFIFLSGMEGHETIYEVRTNANVMFYIISFLAVSSHFGRCWSGNSQVCYSIDH